MSNPTASIQQYAQYCGPAAVAAATGFTRIQCAQALRALERARGRRSRVSTSGWSLIEFLKAVGFDLAEKIHFDRPENPAPTLAQWLASPYSAGLHLVTTPGHVITVRDGEIIEDNGVHHLRSKVVQELRLVRTDRSIGPENLGGYPPCQSDNSYGKIVIQQLSRKETNIMETPANTTAPAASNTSARRPFRVRGADEQAPAGKNFCNCTSSCAGTTRRVFAQGHDARMVSRLRDEVLEGAKAREEAYQELTQRGGSEGLLVKLTRAVETALLKADRKGDRLHPAATAPRAPRAATPLARANQTITVDGFRLHESPSASEPNVKRKVGRWVREGNITEHRIVDGESTDTMRVFRYTDKSGNKMATVKHSNPS